MEYTYHTYYGANWLISSSQVVDGPFLDLLDASVVLELDLKFKDKRIDGYEYLRFTVRISNFDRFEKFIETSRVLGLNKEAWIQTTRFEYITAGVFSIRSRRQLSIVYNSNWGQSLFAAGIQNEKRREQESS